ncbi:hypothetical protein EQ718_26330 (plasmid) [Paracoccus versutus]|nr:hypothetical protein EQ718_26330 [Paracoccus versutus]
MPRPLRGGAGRQGRCRSRPYHQVEPRRQGHRPGAGRARADDPVGHRLGGDRRGLAGECDFPRVPSLDIGGTSADVAVIWDGQPQYGTGELIGDFQLHIPSVAVNSVDALGVLRAGKRRLDPRPGLLWARRDAAHHHPHDGGAEPDRPWRPGLWRGDGG